MNIFYLHHDPKKCAQYHLNRHVVKMILETCQLLCTALWMCGLEAPMKKTHHNHPSAVWARASKANFLWLQQLGLELCYEYTFRYGKIHKCQKIIKSLKVPDSLADTRFTQPTQAMPDEYKRSNSILAYRMYYAYGKTHLHNWEQKAWKNREIPKFIRYLSQFEFCEPLAASLQ